MDRPRRRIPATELRIHLGQALKALNEEDLVIEKGGFPVAILTRYDGAVYRIEKETEMTANAAAYARAVMRPGNPAAIGAALAVIKLGWAGLDADAVVDSIYAARDAGASSRVADLDRDEDQADEEGEDDGQVSFGYRFLPQGADQEIRRVADAPDEGYRS